MRCTGDPPGSPGSTVSGRTPAQEERRMARGILLWLLGVPIPVILLLAMCSHH